MADVHIRYQKRTPTRWSLAIGIDRLRSNKYNDKSGTMTIPKTFL